MPKACTNDVGAGFVALSYLKIAMRLENGDPAI